MNGKQLKNSILQWAIQGKLVPQDPNDEPASVLLERIRAEKARLVKEGKIKKDKNESIIYKGDDNSYYEKFPDGKVVCIDEEIPFEIPQGWEWCRLGNVAEIIGGYAFPSQTIKGNVGTRVIRISDITEKGFSDTRLVRYSGGPISEIYQINQFDILIAMTGGTVGKSLFVMELPEKMLLNQRVAIIRSRHLCAGYINLVIKAPHIIAVINDRKNSTNDNISMVDIYNFLIPIPPLSEQNDIVAKYQEVRPLAERYEKAQLNADALNACLSGKLKSSILQEAIQGKLVPQDSSDEPAEKLLEKINTEKLRLVKEGKLKAKDAVTSVIFKGDDNKYYEQIGDCIETIGTELSFPKSWAVCRLSTICQLTDGIKRAGPGVCLDAKYLRGKSTATILQNGKYVRTGDNIILVDGENSGEVFPVPENGYMGSTFKQLWISETMCKAYVLHTIRFYKDALRNSKKGAAIPHLNKELFYNILIGIPPYQEQERIAARIDELQALLN